MTDTGSSARRHRLLAAVGVVVLVAVCPDAWAGPGPQPGPAVSSWVHGGPPPATGTLVGSWQFDGPVTSTTEPDASGLGNAAVPDPRHAGVSWGRYEPASDSGYAHFDDGILQVDSNPGLVPRDRDIRIDLRMRVTNGAKGSNIIQKGTTHDRGTGFFKIEVTRHEVRCRFIGSVGSARLQSHALVADGRWHTVTCLKSAAAADLWVDNHLEAHDDVVVGANLNASDPISIGGKTVLGTVSPDDELGGDLDYATYRLGGSVPATSTAPTSTSQATSSAGEPLDQSAEPSTDPGTGGGRSIRTTTAGSTQLLSSTATGVAANGRSEVVDARPGQAAFDSEATNLDRRATGGVPQSYLKRFGGGLVLASATASTGPARLGSTGVGFSPDGARFLFVARRGLDGTATGPQAYLRDVATGAVTLVSGDGAAPLANHGLSVLRTSMSRTGALVVFAARDTSYGPGWQVLVRNVATGRLTLASVTTRGAAMASAQESPPVVGFSPDATSVYFDSEAEAVVPGTPPGQVYRRVLATGVTSVVSVDASGAPCRGSLGVVLATGRVVFDSPGLCAAGVPRAKGNVFVTGPGGGQTALVSATAAGVPADDLSTYGAATPDGTKVAFTSGATTLGVPNAAPQIPQIYLKDLVTGALTLVTTPPGRIVTKKVGYTHDMQFDPAGRALLFPSPTTNLLDEPTQPQEVYSRDVVAGVTTRLSIDAAGGQFRAPSGRWADSTHAVLTDDRAGQVYLRTMG